ncbi:MAG: hypothetical protein PVG12_05090 [Gammaproteobacteria bacterium]
MEKHSEAFAASLPATAVTAIGIYTTYHIETWVRTLFVQPVDCSIAVIRPFSFIPQVRRFWA